MKTKKPYFKPWDPQPTSEAVLHQRSLELMRYLKWFTRSCKIKGPADTDLYIIGPQWMKGAKKLIAELEGKPRRLAAAAAIALVLGIPAGARAAGSPDLDPGAHQTGPAECAKILWVGGYRVASPGSCPETGQRRRRHGYTDKAEQDRRRADRDAWQREKKAKHDADKAKDKEDRDARKAKDHEKKCRGLGLPADCSLDNPGHSSPKGKKK